MIAVVEAAQAADVVARGGIHQPWQRRIQAVTQQRKAEEALQEKRAALPEQKKARLLMLQNLKMYVAVVPLKKGGWEAMRKVGLIYFRVLWL